MSIPEVFLQSVLGMALVFFVLVLLMAFIYVMSAVFNRKKTARPPAAAGANVIGIIREYAELERRPARGSCGEVKLYDVPDHTAAMVMAIVADELKAPLGELRFISIKEVEDESK